MNDETRPANVSIILPAKNEAASIQALICALRKRYPHAEILVVDDGSEDDTALLAREAGARVVSHPYSLGNGAAVKSGARAASGDILIFMDADGQHRPEDVQPLLDKHSAGYDMVVGARRSTDQASFFRRLANAFYNKLASMMVGHPIADLTSGMRVATTTHFREILPLLPNGFSYPTTSTIAFFRLGYRVGYSPIKVLSRQGKSHIRLLHDGFRFLLIIIKIGTLYSPLKLFVPLSAATFASGLTYYLYTYVTDGRFTNMSTLLFMASIVVFLFGLLSEQVTTLLYAQTGSQKVDK